MSTLGILMLLALALGTALAVQLGYASVRAIRRRNRVRLDSARSTEMRLAYEVLSGKLAAGPAPECGSPRDAAAS